MPDTDLIPLLTELIYRYNIPPHADRAARTKAQLRLARLRLDWPELANALDDLTRHLTKLNV